MKKELRKALVALVTEKLAARWPTLRRRQRLPTGLLTYQGEVQFEETRSRGLVLVVAFFPHHSGEGFMVELGWSIDGEWPGIFMRPSTEPGEALATAPRCGFVRLARFDSRIEQWWDPSPVDAMRPASVKANMDFLMRTFSPDEARETMRPLVNDAIDRLMRHAPPFFEGIERELAAPEVK